MNKEREKQRELEFSNEIRGALQIADDKGKLSIVSVVTGIPVEILRDIINSTGTIHFTNRITLGMHMEDIYDLHGAHG